MIKKRKEKTKDYFYGNSYKYKKEIGYITKNAVMKKRKYIIIKGLSGLIYPIITTFFFVFIFVTCGGKGLKQDKKAHQEEPPPIKKEFRMAIIPDELTLPNERADYLLIHYWDNFDFSDTAYIHLPEVAEQAFVDYIDIFIHADKEKVHSSIATMLDRSVKEDRTGKIYSYLLNLYKNYLYDANSPMRNDEYYIPVVNYILKDTISDMATKERAKFNLSMMQKNRKGEIATNFSYTLQSGKRETLYQIKSEYILLMFYNPDCHACSETTAYLKQSKLINALLESKQLDILAFYPDEDVDIWKKHLEDIPQTWINSYDESQAVKNKVLYDLKAIPSLYLLDRKKRVLLKDVNILDIETYLKSKLSSSMVYDQSNLDS